MEELRIHDKKLALEIGMIMFNRSNMRGCIKMVEQVDECINEHVYSIAKAYNVIEGPMSAVSYLKKQLAKINPDENLVVWSYMVQCLVDYLIECDKLQESINLC